MLLRELKVKIIYFIILIKFLDNNKKYTDYLETRSFNGVVLKAYNNLYNKGKNLNTDKIKNEKKEKGKENKIKKEDLYDHVYFKTKKEKTNSFHPFIVD
jgi:hypothetical protein